MTVDCSLYDGSGVLITGGASFIGSHLTELLVKSGARVTVIDDLSSGNIGNLGHVLSDVEFVEGDVRREGLVGRFAAGKDYTFHLAAAHGGRGYIDSHPVDCCGNMVIDNVVFTEAAQAGVQTIVHASSACVYPTNLQDKSTSRYLLQEADCNFEEPGKAFADGEYGWAKLMGELQLRAIHKEYGINAIAGRIFTAYGERENESHAVVALIAKAQARLDPFPVWGDGTQTRNFTYVQDTVKGLALAGSKLTGFDVINIGTEQHWTVNQLMETIFDSAGWSPGTIDRQLDKPVGVKARAADCSKSRAELGWAPGTPLKYGVTRTLNWYRQVIGSDHQRQLDQLLIERQPG